MSHVAVAQTNPAITGQWDFKFGDLRATIGADLQYFETASNITTFPTLSINGQPARVMAFGSNSTAQGFLMRHGAQANGGGHFVNQYTLIMDVMFPTNSSGQWRALFQTDPFNDPGNDAEFYIGNSNSTPNANGIGANGQFDGTLAPNTWYRIAFVVDLTASNNLQLIKYMNGARVGSQSLPGGIDGRFALGPTALLFTSGLTNGFTQPGFVGSIQFANGPLNAASIAGLGHASARGIPAPPQFQISDLFSQLGDYFKFSWNGRGNPPLQVQASTNLSGTNWQMLGTLSSVGTLSIPLDYTYYAGAPGFYRVAGLQPAVIDPGIVPELDVTMALLGSNYYYLPTKQIIHTPGQTVKIFGSGGRPLDMIFSHDGKTLFVKNDDSLIVVDVPSWTMLERTNYPEDNASVHGIALSPDGSHVYVTGAYSEMYDYLVASNHSVSRARTYDLPPNSNPCGLTIGSDGKKAYICFGTINSLGVVDLATGDLDAKFDVGNAPYDVVISTDGRRAYVSNWGGRYPTGGDLEQPSGAFPVIVDDRGIASSGNVSVVDLAEQFETFEVDTGLHPAQLKLSSDGITLYVANANSDTITAIDTTSVTVKETIRVRPDSRLPGGSSSSAIALSPDGSTMYVANGMNNAIAVVELPNSRHTNSVVQGFIPTDWYPSAVLADSHTVYAANAFGLPGFGFSGYFCGTVDSIPLPSTDTLSKYTAEVQENGRMPQMLQTQLPAHTNQVAVPIPAHVGEPSVFQHVIYIVKENKTYDCLFGDLPQGDGDPSQCVFPEFYSPNQHALARQYVLLDNFYVNGIQSTDGHYWLTEANNSDYMVKGYNTYPRGGDIGVDPLACTATGYIWDNVISHGLTFTNYGEFGGSFPQAGATWLDVWRDYTNHTTNVSVNTYIENEPVLPRYTSSNAFGFSQAIPDQVRAANFLKEFNAGQSNGTWPAFTILYLPVDHTQGAQPGYPTPAAQIADNDLAVGKVVDAVTHSVFASNTVIFVIEDDALGATDHVDAHRSICLCVSPYTKRHQTISTFFNQVGLVHTMEQIMGLPPMNQMDACGPLMNDCFVNQPDFTPYTALSNNIPLDTMNPGTFGALKAKDRYWAQQSMKLDFSKPDLADDSVLSRIIWHSVKGNTRYPVQNFSAQNKELQKRGLFVSKNVKDDDDD